MKYQITVRITYNNDAFHSETLPDGEALVRALMEDYDAITDHALDNIFIEVLSEEEVPDDPTPDRERGDDDGVEYADPRDEQEERRR